jgi:hypothetical protein
MTKDELMAQLQPLPGSAVIRLTFELQGERMYADIACTDPNSAGTPPTGLIFADDSTIGIKPL